MLHQHIRDQEDRKFELRLIDILGKKEGHGRGGATEINIRMICQKDRKREGEGRKERKGGGWEGKKGELRDLRLESSYLCVDSLQVMCWGGRSHIQSQAMGCKSKSFLKGDRVVSLRISGKAREYTPHIPRETKSWKETRFSGKVD